MSNTVRWNQLLQSCVQCHCCWGANSSPNHQQTSPCDLDDGICCCLAQTREEEEHDPGGRQINRHKPSHVGMFRWRNPRRRHIDPILWVFFSRLKHNDWMDGCWIITSFVQTRQKRRFDDAVKLQRITTVVVFIIKHPAPTSWWKSSLGRYF